MPEDRSAARPGAPAAVRTAEAALIELHHVSFTYPSRDGAPAQPVLHDVSLSIRPGEYVAVLGPNGSGKSTLARLLNGLLRPTTGTVRIAGLDTAAPESVRDIRRLIGMVFQDPDAQMVATVVEEDVAFGLENLGVPRDEMRRRVDEALRRVGMEAHRHRPPHQLSGGQKQRVAIAGVVAMQPRCIVFDEATSMLDVEGREDVVRLMGELNKLGLTIVTITHHMAEALCADRVVVLHHGRIVMDASPREVFRNVDLLRQLRLDVPAPADLANRMLRRGWPLPEDVLTAEEFAQAVAALRQPAAVRVIELAGKRTDAGGGRRSGGTVSRVQAVEPPAAAGSGSEPNDRTRPDSAGGDAVRGETEPIIRVRGLSHTYLRGTPLEQPALQDISFDLFPGETTALVGHTGSGKSTLVQLLAGLLIPQQGSVVIDGVPVRRHPCDLRRIRRTVGLVFQRPEAQLFEALIGDDIAYGPFQYGLTVEEARDRVRFAMEAVGLDFSWRDRPIHALSGGERRKVAIAGVLALMPKVLVLDEPTAGLDPASRDELLARLDGLRRDHGMSLVLVTHRMEEVAALAQRVLVMEHGRLVWQGTPREWFADPRRPDQLGLGRPETVEIARACRAAGIPVQGTPLTRDEAEAAVLAALREGGGDAGGL